MKTHSSLDFLFRVILLLVAAILLSASSDVAAEEDEKRGSKKLTPIELQSKLMSFSDRFATIMDESF